MIDWKVQIRGHSPAGWDQRQDGCWFPDFDHQEYLLPYFDVGESPIDEYGATEFSPSDVQRLREHLQCYRAYVEAKPESWTITEASARGSRTIRIERERVLAVVDKTQKMIEVALGCGGSRLFCGD